MWHSVKVQLVAQSLSLLLHQPHQQSLHAAQAAQQQQTHGVDLVPVQLY